MGGLTRMRNDKEELERKILHLIFYFEKANDIQVTTCKLKSYQGVDRKHIDDVTLQVKL